jgi:hypothetical protein
MCRGSCALYGLVVVSIFELFTVWTCGIYRLKFSMVRQLRRYLVFCEQCGRGLYSSCVKGVNSLLADRR